MPTSNHAWRAMLPIKPRPRSLMRLSLSPRHSSDLSSLREELISRKLPILKDYISPVPTGLLRNTLGDLLPYPILPGPLLKIKNLPHGYHLIYFPPRTHLSTLFPDGTDPLHSPGPPFNRRVWAGGDIRFSKAIPVDLSAFFVMEKIVDVQINGENDAQKVFVTIQRNVYQGIYSKRSMMDKIPHIVETRNIAFMRERPKIASCEIKELSSKVLKSTHSPDFSVIIVPTPALLFRFSALTFNAHAIHLDKTYCLGTEGHRNLLVHGPLTLLLMLEVLRIFLRKNKSTQGRTESIRSVEYRNLVPLYAEEEMKICVRRKTLERTAGSFDIWIEGKEGGYAVKGLVRTSIREIIRPFMFNTQKSAGTETAKGDGTDRESASASMVEIATGNETVPETTNASVDENITEGQAIEERNDPQGML